MNSVAESITRDIEYYCKEKENQHFERKSARTEPKEILRAIVAFANAEGGHIVIGIEDDGEITGFKQNKSKNIESYKNISLTELRDTPFKVEYVEKNIKNSKDEDDRILIVIVPPSPKRIIKMNDGTVYLRQLSNSVKLNHEQITQLEYDKGQRFFEEEIVSSATLDDLDLSIVEEFKIKLGALQASNEDILEARNLLVKGNITTSALLLFGKNPSKYLPQARVKIIKYEGNTAKVGSEINIVKEVTFDDCIPKIIDKCANYIRTQLREFQYLDLDGKFKKMPEYPEFAWFEGMVNALTHRDYSIRGDYIKIKIFDDSLEIISPGTFPSYVTKDNLLNTRYSRNPTIARILSEFGWVKEINEGVKRIYSEMENLFLKAPIYKEENFSVHLKLENNLLNRRFRFDDKLKGIFTKEVVDDLSSHEKFILHYMFNTSSTLNTKKGSDLLNRGTTYTLKILKGLEKRGFLKWEGSSKNDKSQHYRLNF
ncbi:RNA-binding domain-containing protein [Taylorella asinigenitalis]|uniref:ATP-dependent DNA helicase recG n=1 Tax=Taylorella asinigenitalis (strain MCE3) TaxID=1008459 RepID=G4QBR1_TAYAM|nr:RNA-binding domain-containing protein [Taylorella asinigenitalis]AEP37256.1 ATP-dependent DNA helicase recG [Taylorella asinigenitalis MCE3]